MKVYGLVLPKQWKHWVKKAGLKCDYHPRAKGNWLYLVGHNRRWRVDFEMFFEMSEPEENFDRWANSGQAQRFLANVAYEHEFLELVNDLLADDSKKDEFWGMYLNE